MLRHLALALLVVCTPAYAQTDPLLQQLLALDSVNRAEVTTAPGHYGFLRGRLAKDAGGAEATGRQFLKTYGKLLGFPDGEAGVAEFTVTSNVKDDGGDTLVFEQMGHGLPFTAGQIVMQFDRSGTLVGVSGRYRPLPPLVPATIDARRAVQIALEDLRKLSPNNRLAHDGEVQQRLILEQDGKLHWRFVVNVAVGDPVLPRIVTVGGDGTVLDNSDGSRHAEAIGSVAPDYPKPDVADRTLPDLDEPDSLGVMILAGPYLTSESSFEERAATSTKAFRYPVKIPVPALLGHPTEIDNPKFLETNVYWLCSEARRKAKDWGIKGVDDHKLEYDVYVTKLRNLSSYAPYWKFPRMHHKLIFSATYINNTSLARDQSVVWHEFGHFAATLTRSEINSETLGEFEVPVVCEGFADFFSASMSGNPLIGKLGLWAPRDCEKPDKYDPKLFEKLKNGKPAKVNGHDKAAYFSAILWEIRKRIGDPDVTMRLVVQALRYAKAPIGFKEMGHALMIADIRHFDWKHEKILQEVLTKRGVFPAGTK